jgi:WD40 repeat protein
MDREDSASEDKTLKVWDLETGLPVATLRYQRAVLCRRG